ncbi:hypothetical protein BVC80_8839g12 [Macleaya cordata]|uniref:SET domain-containing protein n=1 Tax=Macleaya cordata TaxID=56857 RepID=A0A200RDZ7_MACCD|nr:hypothetical protein BVC80_8839g12 [Macleaya cordata]
MEFSFEYPILTVENMEGSYDFSLVLALSNKDPLFEKKKKLLKVKGFDPEIRVLFSSSENPLLALQVMVEAARIIHLDETELYFGGVETCLPYYSPRNELESLNSILSLIDTSLKNAAHNKVEVLCVLRDTIIDMIRAFGNRTDEETVIEKCTCHAEELLLQWGQNHGLQTKLQIAHVEGAGRGAVAVEDLKIGDTALDIPLSVIISEEFVYESDMFHVLKEIDGISTETMLLLWSMKERYNPDSKFKIYFETLPETFNTGLNFGIDALTALEGTLLFEEIIQAKEHLRTQYDELCPALCSDHPDVFQEELYTWERFLWACELWYSNSMKVIFTDGKLRTCLVPIAGLLNHSLFPHILHYGRVDSVRDSLKFSLSRPCAKGEQCYLSYGKLSSSHLITFYGFVPKGDNPYDIIPLDIDAPQTDESGGCSDSDWTSHMVRGTWLSSNHEIFYYGLPPPLLHHLRTALNGEKLPMETYKDIENERAVLETLCSIFDPMMEGLGDSEHSERVNLSWDVKLALEYKELQRRIISSILSSCSAGHEMLQCFESKDIRKPANHTDDEN